MRTSFPKNRIRVLLAEKIHEAGRLAFEEAGFAVECVGGALDESAVKKHLRAGAGPDGVHVLGIRSKTHLSAEALTGASRLLAVGCFCIGTNQVDLRSACARGIPVFNSPFSNTRSVAELTVAEVVALHRRLAETSGAMHRGVWNKSSTGAREVRGRTLGIVGYGHIGSQVSVLAEAMGMRVLYHDIAPRLPLGNARPCRSLEELAVQSDVITLHIPATEATNGLVSARIIERMPRGAMLINNARGSVVDIAALARALKAGRLAGAAIDVFPEEPEGGTDSFKTPLQGLPNVILTPHIGGSTEEAQEAIARDVASKLIRFVDNGSTTGAVNVPVVDLPEQAVLNEPGTTRRAKDKGGRRHRVLHFHRNVPGVLSKMHALIADLGANIAGEHLQTNADVGYVVLDVDPTDGEAIVDRLKAIPETIRVRLLW